MPAHRCTRFPICVAPLLLLAITACAIPAHPAPAAGAVIPRAAPEGWNAPAHSAASAITADDLTPVELKVQGAIEHVVLYPGRAAVTRVVRQPLDQGLWAVRVSNLPATVQPQSLQATVERGAAGASAGGDPKVLSVEYAQALGADFSGTPEGLALQTRVKDLRQRLEYLKQDDAQLDVQLKLVDQVGIRATANATNDGGTQALDLETVRKQLEFVAKERASLVERKRALATQGEELNRQLQAAQEEWNARGGADRMERAAVIVVAMPHSGPVELRLTYLVSQATWEPVYNVRASGDRRSVEIEYDANITQATGEDWTDVRLSLSTAQPTRASEPPAVTPWYVAEYVPPPAAPPPATGRMLYKQGDGGEVAATAYDAAAAPSEALRAGVAIEALAAGAQVQETGVAVAFDLPRTVTVPSDREKKQRTRIATVIPAAQFVYSAQPLVDDGVYLRGDLTNDSAYQFLPGMAQIFMGGDFVGQSRMPGVAPKDEFKVYFGPERALRATRQVLRKTTGNSGLFGGSTTTTWNYRVAIDNGTGRAVTVELFDRRPVSRNDKITVNVSKLSTPLSTDNAYTTTLAPLGILRWDLAVPASARGDAALAITWTVEVTHPNAMKITPLPD